MVLVRNWQEASMLLLVRQFQTTTMLAWMPNYYIQRSGRIGGIVLAKIERIYTAPTAPRVLGINFPVIFL
jgi:hypothetical protein